MRFSEFVARSEIISFQDIIPLLQHLYVNAHNWNIDDSVKRVFESKRRYVINVILETNVNNKKIVGEVVYDFIRDENGFACEPDPVTGECAKELKLDRSYVHIISLMEFIVGDIKDESLIPNALKELIGISPAPVEYKNLETKYDPKMDRLVCQGIARTLWDIEPKMTLKDMAMHKAIQIYGNGSQYKDAKTVPGWLSEVDPRPEEKRRGPKKKCMSEEGEG